MFDEEVVAAIVRHMNSDHIDDNLTICRSNGAADALSASMIGFDGDGADFEIGTARGTRKHRVQWSRRIGERAEVRAELVRLVEEAG